jgi:hypothetical protein
MMLRDQPSQSQPPNVTTSQQATQQCKISISSMLTIDRTAAADVPAASPGRCLARLQDAQRYPEWSSLIKSAEPIEAGRVRLRAELLGVSFEMDCELETDGATRAVLRRVPNDLDDEERFEAAWTVTRAGRRGAHVELHVRALLDAPGPARLIRGRVERRLTDDLLADFTRSA